MTQIKYKTDYVPTVEEFRIILNGSGLGERRPVSDSEILHKMLIEADLIVTAWEGEEMIGIARSLTDYAYCCYLSDLAVNRDFQKKGIGSELIKRTELMLEESCTLILLSAPDAVSYYLALGMKRHPAAFVTETIV